MSATGEMILKTAKAYLLGLMVINSMESGIKAKAKMEHSSRQTALLEKLLD